MKRWTKKAISLFLVAVMIAAMIPFAVFTTSGLDYSKAEFSISSVTDWNDIAAYSAANPSARFTGKTIKLAKSIDFGGETIATLFASNFEGTFDGQGYTLSNFKTTKGAVIANVTNAGSVIKNLKVNGAVEYNTYHTDGTNGWQVFAGMIVNRMDEGTISDVSVAGSITSNAYNVGAVVGSVSLADGKSATIQNIEVSATVHNNRTRISCGWHAAGGVAGNVDTYGRNATLVIKGVNMSGTVTRDLGPAGGIVGAIYDKDGSPALYTSGNISIENCAMTGTVSSNTGSAGNGVGGIVGTFGAFKRDCGEYTAFDGTLKINNCVVGGVLKNTNTTSTEALAVGGIIGTMGYSNAVADVEHCLITASFPNQSPTATNGKGAGLVLGAGMSQGMSSVIANNIAATVSGAMIGHVIAKEGSGAAWLSLNGKSLTSVAATNSLDTNWVYTNSITDGSVLTVLPDAESSMVQKDAAGYIRRVGGQIYAFALQDDVPDGATLTANDSYAIRFIGATQVSNIASAKMQVLVRDSKTGAAIRRYEKDCVLYDALRAYTVKGEQMAFYKASDYGAKKFLALTIGDIPGGKGYTFEFSPSYTTTEGVTVTAEPISMSFDANGQHVKGKDSFDVAPYVSSPTVRVISSNILVTDLEQTDYTSFLTDHEQRYANMAALYNFYQPDFIGLQEVGDSPKVNGVNCFDGVKTMQSVLKSYMNSAYEYVDFSAKLGSNSHFTPIMYNSAKWEVVEVDYDTTKECRIIACTMHRWQWARFRSIENPEYEVIVFNLHGPNAEETYHGHNVKINFFTDANAQIKKLEQQYPTVPIFVTGDYNANPANSEHVQYMNTLTTGTTLVDSYDLEANCEPNSHGNIDHIYMTGGDATVLQNRSLYNLASIKVSTDHAPILADFRLNRKTPIITGSSMSWNDGEVLS